MQTPSEDKQPKLMSKLKNQAMRSMEFIRNFGGFIRDGISFRGNRDIYAVYGYKNVVTFYDCLAKYQRQGMASRIVDKPSDAIWSDAPSIVNASPNLTNILTDLTQRLGLWQKLNRADKLCGLGLYSTILVGVDDGQPLSSPLRPSTNRKITFLQPCSIETMRVTQFISDPTDPRFGKPLFYSLNFAKAGGVGGSASAGDRNNLNSMFSQFSVEPTQVHFSRVIHIADSVLEDETYGIPRMVKVYNTLEDMLKVGGGSAEIFWLNSRGGLHIDVDKEMDLDPQDEEDLTQEIDDYSNNLRRIMRTKGVTISPVNMQEHDPRKAWAVLLDDLASSTGIPQRVLMGAEAGQLASDQDRANWAVFVDERRLNFAEPQVIRPLFQFLTYAGMIKLSDYQTATILWPEAFKMNPLERGQTSAQQARAVANLMKTFGDSAQPLLSLQEARGIIKFGNSAPFGGAAEDVDKGIN